MNSTISNKTQKPLSIRLPRDRTLHLGPGKTGQISAKDADHPVIKKLVDTGEVEILADGARSIDGGEGGKRSRASFHGYASGAGARRSGDR